MSFDKIKGPDFNNPAQHGVARKLHQIFIGAPKSGKDKLATDYAANLGKECVQLTLDDFDVTKKDPLSQRKNCVVVIDVEGADAQSRVIQQALMMHMDRHAGLIFILKGQPEAMTHFLKPVGELKYRFEKPIYFDGAQPVKPTV